MFTISRLLDKRTYNKGEEEMRISRAFHHLVGNGNFSCSNLGNFLYFSLVLKVAMKHTESLAVAGLIFTVITIRDISCGRQKCLLIVVNYFKTNENISHFLESNFTSGLKRERRRQHYSSWDPNMEISLTCIFSLVREVASGNFFLTHQSSKMSRIYLTKMLSKLVTKTSTFKHV